MTTIVEAIVRKIVSAAFILLVIGTSVPAESAVVASCGGSEGYTYFHEGRLVPKNKSGWAKDKIGGGRLILLREGENYDIVFIDSLNRTISHREDGANLISVFEQDNTYVILVVYPHILIEVYVFQLDSQGRGEVTFHQSRYGPMAPIRKDSVMRAACEK